MERGEEGKHAEHVISGGAYFAAREEHKKIPEARLIHESLRDVREI